MGQKVNATQQRSELGYAEVTVAQGGVTSEVDLTGLTITVNVPAGATVLLEGKVSQLNSSATGDRGDLSLYEGATSLDYSYGRIDPSSSGWGGARVSARLQPSAGSHTYKMRFARGAGTGTASTYASTNAKAYLQARIV